MHWLQQLIQIEMSQADYSPQEFTQLIVSAASYTTKIEAFSNKISEASMQDQLLCLSQALTVLNDQSMPIIKKLFVIRFVKDTMLLASLSFYECVLIKIYPWLTQISQRLSPTDLQKKYSEVAKFLRGSKELATAQMSVCKNFVNLIEDVIKWMGTYIRQHPYSKIKFRSAFRILLQDLPAVQVSKVSSLNFFKPQDPNRYQAYYLQKESGEVEGEKIGQYIRAVLEGIDKGEDIDTLQHLVETGDGNVINYLIEELDARLEDIERQEAIDGIKILQLIDELMRVGQIQLCMRIKLDLLPKIVNFIEMLEYHKIKYKSQSAAAYIKSMLDRWKDICQRLAISIGCYQQAFAVLAKYGVTSSQNSKSLKYTSHLKLTPLINQDKGQSLQLNESETILKIRMVQYIPLYESKMPKRKEESLKNSMNPAESEKSLSSNKSSAKKIQYLETYSKIPQNNQLKTNSQVKQLYFQHSNISDRFLQLQNKPQPSTPKQLLISFKKYDENSNSPEVVFSDSFNSNQKYSPVKQMAHKKYIDVIEEHSLSVVHSENSKQSRQKRIEQKQFYNSSYQKSQDQNLQLYQQSNKKTSKISEVSDYYPEQIKYSANFRKQSSSQVKNSSKKNSLVKDSSIKRSQVKNSIINDYMIPENNSQGQFNKRSEISIKPREEKSSSIKSIRIKGAMRSSSREKVVVSPRSKISNSRSIKLIQFNEAQCNREQGYQIPPSGKTIRQQVEPIRVQRTIKKPKFGFKVEDELAQTEELESIQNSNQELIYSLSKTESISVDPLIQSRQLNEVPQNFGDLLTRKRDNVKVNNYEHKIKQLEHKISRMKAKKDKIEREVIIKDQEISKIKQQMPIPLNVLEAENQELLKALRKDKQVHTNQFRQSSNHQFKGAILHLSVVPIQQHIKKQMLYSKCRLLQSQDLEVGMQTKEKQITFYFAFKKQAEEFSVKVVQNSLQLKEPLDARIYNILIGKQIKFKISVADLHFFDSSFEFGMLRIDLKLKSKTSKIYNIAIPYHLYNELKFYSPRNAIIFTKSTDWHFCCSALLEGYQYLEDIFPNGDRSEGKYHIQIQSNNLLFDYLIIIEGEKFKIEFEDRLEALQTPLLKCLLSLL